MAGSGWDGCQGTPNASLCHSQLRSTNSTNKNDFFAHFLVFFVTYTCPFARFCFKDDQHPPWEVTFPCSSRAASTGNSHARARTSAHVAHRHIGTRPQPPAHERVPTQPQPCHFKAPAMEVTALLNPDLGRHPALTRPLAGWCRFRPTATAGLAARSWTALLEWVFPPQPSRRRALFGVAFGCLLARSF